MHATNVGQPADVAPWRGWEIDHADDVALIEVAPGIRLPEAYSYRERSKGVDVTLRMRVAAGEELVCERIELAPGEASLSARVVHALPIGRLLQDAGARGARVTRRQPEPETPDEAFWERQRLIEKLIARQRGEDDPVQAATRVRRPTAIPMDDEKLAQVAEDYVLAQKLGHPPTATVAAEYNVSRATASRWVRRARDRGLLDAV
jgi:hypothetical protein